MKIHGCFAVAMIMALTSAEVLQAQVPCDVGQAYISSSYDVQSGYSYGSATAFAAPASSYSYTYSNLGGFAAASPVLPAGTVAYSAPIVVRRPISVSNFASLLAARSSSTRTSNSLMTRLDSLQKKVDRISAASRPAQLPPYVPSASASTASTFAAASDSLSQQVADINTDRTKRDNRVDRELRRLKQQLAVLNGLHSDELPREEESHPDCPLCSKTGECDACKTSGRNSSKSSRVSDVEQLANQNKARLDGIDSLLKENNAMLKKMWEMKAAIGKDAAGKGAVAKAAAAKAAKAAAAKSSARKRPAEKRPARKGKPGKSRKS